ncbi:KIN4C, partial [Symbiodinium sp. KB8]
SSQDEVYETVASPLLPKFFEGYNCSILAYGQTGSGKTYTMGSGSTSFEGHTVGLIPRVIREIFRYVETNSSKWKCTVRVSFVEVYNEQVRDLLGGVYASKTITVRDDHSGNVVMAGMEEREVAGVEELKGVVQEGTMARATGSTNMNAQSSRSHAILIVSLEQEPLAHHGDASMDGTSGAEGEGEAEEEEHRISKFYLVDLAGSERAKKTQAEGQRLMEGININKGLLALGNVIKALSSSKSTASEEGKDGAAAAAASGSSGPQRGAGESNNATALHVPYRDSKLTRILQDSLGGNSQTAMIACVSPADSNMDESFNTLRYEVAAYASRARNIKNHAVKNTDPNDAKIAALKREVSAASLLTQTLKP